MSGYPIGMRSSHFSFDKQFYESYTGLMKSNVLLIALLVLVQLLMTACTGPVTIISTTTVTAAPTSATLHSVTITASTSQATTSLRALSNEGVEIKTHNRDNLAAYKGMCLACHGKDMPNQFPLPLTWDGKAFGSTIHTGVYSIKPGSNADHTGVTSEGCTKDDCHS
jgi:hypothetical protein